MHKNRDPPVIAKLGRRYPVLRLVERNSLEGKLLWELAIATLTKKEQRMTRLSADFTEMQDFTPVPEDKYHVQIKNITEEKSKKENPQLRFDLRVLGGEYNDRELRDWIVIGGKGEKGPITPFGLYRAIE